MRYCVVMSETTSIQDKDNEEIMKVPRKVNCFSKIFSDMHDAYIIAQYTFCLIFFFCCIKKPSRELHDCINKQ